MNDRAYAKAQAQQKTLIRLSPKNSLLQRTCACGQHTIAGGECSTCRSEQSTLFRSQRAFGPPSAPGGVQGNAPAQENDTSFNAAFNSASRFGHDFSRIPIHSPAPRAIQTKLAINKPGDEYEQEADRISQQVMRMPEPQLQRACTCDGACPECQAEQPDHERLQMKHVQASDTEQSVASPIVHEVLRSPGQPLDAATRAFMEPRFGYDFNPVRVHVDNRAAESARAVNALAYTVGNHVVFGDGKYEPQSGEGRKLLAHELAHTIQQEGTGCSFSRKPEIGEVEDAYERQADSAGERVIHGDKALGLEVAPRQLGRLQEFRLQRSTPPTITASQDLSGVQAQLEAIIRTGGPLPTDTRVIGAAIIDVEGFTGPKEMRAISGMGTDTLGQGAPVYHATTPTERTLSATRSISGSGPRRDFPFWHKNDAEMKMFEDIIRRLPPNPKGTIHFLTMRVRHVGGRTVIEPMPACSGCTRATFELAGLRGINVVSHAATHPTGSLELGGTPPSTPPGRLLDPGKTTTQAAGTRKVTAEVGAPLEPVVEATPGFRPERGAGIGGAFQILQAMQFANIQQAEINKFQKRFAELQPKIDAFLERGYSVELILIVEKPDRPDVFCAAGVFCDQSQFVYFRDLYINYVETVKPIVSPSPPRSYPTMGPVGGRSGYIPYTHEGGSIIDEKEIRFLHARHADYHCDYAKQTLYPQEYAFPISPVVPRHQPAQPEKPKPRLDPAARKALAAAPARVYVMSEGVIQYKTAYEVIKALADNPLFGEVKEYRGGLGRTRTIISYRNDLDKAKAEALAEIVRSKGVPTASAELSGSGDDDPGVLTIWFGRDAEKPR